MSKRQDLPLKPVESQFTDGQWQAIYDGGDNILVSASAGSGKTTVLVQRVIEKIKSGVNVDELLIVTYTEAAAKEMKQRIQKAVQEAITVEGEEQRKRHLIQQLSLLPTAHISTLHAFCLQVIRKYYYLIQIDPVFRLLTDETEMLLLKEDVWDELREGLYASDRADFYQLTANFSNDRSDQGLTEVIFSLYEFARSNPDPQGWLRELASAYDVGTDLASSSIYQSQLRPELLSQARGLVTQSQQMLSLVEGDEQFEKVRQLMQVEVQLNEQLLELLEGDDLESVYDFLSSSYTFGRYPGLRNLEGAAKEINDEVKELRERNKKRVADWKKGIFSVPPAKMLEVMAAAKVMVEQMASVASQFERAYAKRKREKNLVDFNDLEHFTLQILATVEEGQWTGTEASNYYREKFTEVLVDEYQDINQLQENILLWLRQPEKNNGNLFMVGDVKQSIYSFRLADPTLFIDKYEAYGQGEDGRRIILAENFRSRRDVLDFTNLVFSQLMSPSLGQLAYDEPAQLVHGFTGFPEVADFRTEVLIFENESGTEETVEDLTEEFQVDDKTEGELRLVGHKIHALIQEAFPVYDKGTKQTRPLRYSDIVLLTPTKKNNLVLLDLFKELNIPLHINDTQNYFQATEIRIMIALLNVIDNPYQDIPLAAVLRSPLVGVKENDLALIRGALPEGSYFDALSLFLAEGESEPALASKLTTFMSQLDDWREMARRQQLVALIWKIYQDTGFLDYVGGLPSGQQRQANLHALYERATSYEEMSFKGLFQFVRFIEKMQSKDKDLAEPTAINEDEDAVRVMTIHASKGLEFPVVFVLDLTRRFNLMDLRQDYIFDAQLGAGIKYTDAETRLFYRTLPYLGIQSVKRKKLLAEEMRKLYVALTRAEEKLFLVGSYRDAEAAWKKWGVAAAEPGLVIAPDVRLQAQSLMDWLGMTLIRHPEVAKLQETYEVAKQEGIWQHPADVKVSFSNLTDLRQQSLSLTPPVQVTPAGKQTPEPLTRDEHALLATISERLEFTYPFMQATHTTSYQSVSEIKRVFEDPDQHMLLTLDLSEGEGKTLNRFADEQLAIPKFMQETKAPTGAEVGTGTHLVMQLLPLTATPSRESIDELIADLVARGALEAQVAAKIERERLLNFYASPFGQRLLNNHHGVRREQPFSLLLRAETIFHAYPAAAQDDILIHGIIDGYYESAEELILYDFKTDYLPPDASPAALAKLKQKYRGQLALYRRALEQVKERPVTSVKLILLSADLQIEMLVP